MAIPGFLKKKRTYALLIIVVLGFLWFQNNAKQAGKITYETAAVERADLRQTIDVTGEIKPAERIELAFDRNGTIRAMNVTVGDEVKQGDILAELKDDEVGFALRSAGASLEVAKANLNQRAAGATSQEIRIAETNVNKAKAAYDKAVTDYEAAKRTVQDNLRTAQLTVETAKNKLDNQSNTLTQSYQNALDSLKIALLTALGPMHTGLTDGDAIVGVDDTATNSSYRLQLGIYDGMSMTRARTSYQLAKPAKMAAETAVKGLSATSTEASYLAVSDTLLNANLLVQNFLGDVQKVLASSIAGPGLTSTELATKKSTIDSDRSSISAQNTAVLTAIQALKNVTFTNTDTRQQLADAYQTALVNLSIAQTKMETDVKAAEANLAIQEAALESAKADLDQKKAPVREADLAPLRASVQQAQVAYDKAVNDLKKIQIIAPVNGTVSEVLPDVGEQASMNSVAIKMVGTQSYDIEALVPEADITKMSVSQAATITLDAFGDDVRFNGTVTAKDPAETRVQDAIYYKIRVQIDPAGLEVKPGMTANVTIITAERKGALIIPLRAVRTLPDAQQKVVRVFVNEVPQQREVTLGLKGDEGRVEVISGLAEKELVIVGERGGLPN